jgi:Leucine-rich repeat (LRR) protein
MLGSDRFAFETPNVIDPGDLPPSRPNRNDTGSTANTTKEEDEDYDAQYRRSLLNDIGDLDLSPVKVQATNGHQYPSSPPTLPYRDFPRQGDRRNHAYSPYDDGNQDGDDDDDSVNNDDRFSHSLPSSEEARIHAATLLRGTNSKFGRTLKLNQNRQDPYRQRKNQQRRSAAGQHILAFIFRFGYILLAAVILFAIVLGVGIGISKKHHSSEASMKDYSKTDRFQAALNYLVNNQITNQDDLTNSHTPQYAALNWMAGEDAVMYELESDQFLQRYALSVLYFATGGAQAWGRTLGFASSTQECSWNEIIHVAEYLTQELAVGASCNSNLQVTSLFLPTMGLKGSLPSEMRLLTKLQLLSIQNNFLAGELPHGLESLHNLIYVNFNNNTLNGTIPAYLGDFPGLEILGLGYNDLEGSVPLSFGTASKLKTLQLSNNSRLAGTLDSIRYLGNLEYLYADNCNFEGVVASDFFIHMPELRELDLSRNQLSGPLPLDILIQEHNLEVLDLSGNHFYGKFPPTITYNIALRYLNLRENNITGAIPDTIFNLVGLERLDLTGNELTGHIPNGLGRLPKIESLFLGGNTGLGKKLPPLTQLLNLKYMSLSNIGLEGPIPTWLPYLTNLELLDLSHNNLTGTIDSDLWNMPKLYFLLLDNNALVGPLPEFGGDQLDTLSLQHNDIQDSNLDNVLCSTNKTHLEIVVTDCNAGCTDKCCEECCHEDDHTCAASILNLYRRGFDFVANSLAFDPDLLDEAGLFQTFDMQDASTQP